MSAPNLKELDWAIAELESQESSERRYILLAALYICRYQMLGNTQPRPAIAAYSEAPRQEMETLGQYGDSEFLRTVAGKTPEAVWGVIDELMETLQVINARAYESVMRKLGRL